MTLTRETLASWRGNAVSTVRRLFRRTGFDLVRYHHTSHPVARLLRLFDHYGVRQVFDVGANVGQFGMFMRKNGYRGKLVSFEPLSTALPLLRRRAEAGTDWSVVPIGLGDFDGEATINVAGNSESSSLLGMLPRHTEIMPIAGYIGSETVTIRRLDSVIDEHAVPGQPLFVKLDAQGFEKKIVAGAAQSLARIVGFQIELSPSPLYAGEAPLSEMVQHMTNLGYLLMGVEPGWSDDGTGQLMQMDGVFFKV
jgi:FkbM family methyltransferase